MKRKLFSFKSIVAENKNDFIKMLFSSKDSDIYKIIHDDFSIFIDNNVDPIKIGSKEYKASAVYTKFGKAYKDVFNNYINTMIEYYSNFNTNKETIKHLKNYGFTDIKYE